MNSPFKIEANPLTENEYTKRKNQILKENLIPKDLESIAPKLLYEYAWSTFFGQVKINLKIEDRRPDLFGCITKYRHKFFFKFFWKEVSFLIHTASSPGFCEVDKNEIQF